MAMSSVGIPLPSAVGRWAVGHVLGNNCCAASKGCVETDACRFLSSLHSLLGYAAVDLSEDGAQAFFGRQNFGHNNNLWLV
jgi:hypothetical protein